MKICNPSIFCGTKINIKPDYLESTSILNFVGAASSRDHFNSRLEAAPTGVFLSYLDLPDMRNI